MAKRWIENVLVRSLGLRPGERVVVMADRRLQPAARELAAAAREFGAARVLHVTLPEPGRPLALVSGAFVRAVRQADVVITMRSGLSLLDEDPHIRAAMSAFREAGRGRWAVLAQVDPTLLEHELSADFGAIAAEAERLARRLRAGTRLRLVSEAGTDLTLRYGGRPVIVETGSLRDPGSFGNLPPGEVYVAPWEQSAEGRVVVDQCLGDLRLDKPVTLTFAQGRVVAVEGGRAAEELVARLGRDPWAWTIGEFGLGANPYIRRRGRVAHDEKALGTAHIALGSNRAFGGANPAATHYDCVLAQPRVYVEA